jgi:hypothetical protein
MRLLRTEHKYVPQFTMLWEVEALSMHKNSWVPLCIVGTTQAIGEIHGGTHEVRLYEGVVLRDRQVVALDTSMLNDSDHSAESSDT